MNTQTNQPSEANEPPLPDLDESIDLMETLGSTLRPVGGVLFYAQSNRANEIGALLAFDTMENGTPINLRPLSPQSAATLAATLTTKDTAGGMPLRTSGLLPQNLLAVDARSGEAIWYSPPQKRVLPFVEGLKGPTTSIALPGLIWQASKEGLRIVAVRKNPLTGKDRQKLRLYHAPFMNIYNNGGVCMGTTRLKFPLSLDLDEFIKKWEEAFWGSLFSHPVGSRETKTDLMSLYHQLADNRGPFPITELLPTNQLLSDLL